MKTYSVYILLCSDGTYYTGVTNNLERRLAEHQEGENPGSYTFKRRPVKLLWDLSLNNINEAIDLEKQIKGWSRKKKEAIMRDDWDELVRLSMNRSKRFDGLSSPPDNHEEASTGSA